MRRSRSRMRILSSKKGKHNTRKSTGKGAVVNASPQKSESFDIGTAKSWADDQATLLAGSRLSNSSDPGQRARMVTAIQRNHGNAYVQRIMDRIQGKSFHKEQKSGPQDLRGAPPKPEIAARPMGNVINRWAEEEHKAFGDLAAQMAMKHDWSFLSGEETTTPAGVGEKSDAVHGGKEEYKKFIKKDVSPLKKKLKKKIGKEKFAKSGVGVAHYKEVMKPVSGPEGPTYVPTYEKRYMSFGDATMLGGDYFKTAGDLKKAQTVNPLEMSTRMKYVAATNVNHFFPLAGKEWETQYAKAIELAHQARSKHVAGEKSEADRKTEEALRYLGIAVHFLQDTFASGHQYPGALDDIDSLTAAGIAMEGGPRKTYHDALCALKGGMPMQYGSGRRFRGDYAMSASDAPVVVESYRALAHILAIISGKKAPTEAPKHNPGPDVSAIMKDKEAGPIWTSMVKHLEESKLPSARKAAKEGKKGYTTSAGTPYSAKYVMDEWSKLGKMKKKPTTTVEKLVDAALKGQSNLLYIATKEGMTGIGKSTDTASDDAIRAIIKTEGIPKLTHNQTVMVLGALLTGTCGDEDEKAVLQILNAQTDAVFRSVVRELTPEYIDKGLDGEEWDTFLYLCAKRYSAGSNLGAKLIVKDDNDVAIRMLTGVKKESPIGTLSPIDMNRLSPNEWIKMLNVSLSGRCGDEDEDAIVNILGHLVLTKGMAHLVNKEIGKSKMDGAIHGAQWKQVLAIMKAGGVDWT